MLFIFGHQKTLNRHRYPHEVTQAPERIELLMRTQDKNEKHQNGSQEIFQSEKSIENPSLFSVLKIRDIK